MTERPSSPAVEPIERRGQVWLTGQRPAGQQRAGRYDPDSTAHPAKMLPAIARALILEHTEPGDWVCDPMAGIGTTLREALDLDRNALGVEYEPRWAQLARTNTTRTSPDTNARRTGVAAHIVNADSRALPNPLPAALRRKVTGRVRLLLTSPPYGASVHGQVDAQPGQGVRKTSDRYSTDPGNLAHRSHTQQLDGLLRILNGTRSLLHPDAVIALTVRPIRQHRALLDLPGIIQTFLTDAGYQPLGRQLCLIAGLRNGQVIPRASFFQLNHIRRMRAAGLPVAVIGHEDLLLFRPPAAPTTSENQPRSGRTA